MIESDRVWEWVRGRSEALSGRNADFKVVEQFRCSLAQIILRLGGHMVIGDSPLDGETGAGVRRWLSASEFASIEVDRALADFADSELRQVRTAARRAAESVREAPAEGRELAMTLLEGSPALEYASALLGPTDSRLGRAADEMAKALRKCLLGWVCEADGQVDEALRMTEAALAIPGLGGARDVLENDVKQLRLMILSNRPNELVSALAERCKAILTAQIRGMEKYKRLPGVFEFLKSIQAELPADSAESELARSIVAHACNDVAVELLENEGEIGVAVRMISYGLAMAPQSDLASQMAQNLAVAEQMLRKHGQRLSPRGRQS